MTYSHLTNKQSPRADDGRSLVNSRDCITRLMFGCPLPDWNWGLTIPLPPRFMPGTQVVQFYEKVSSDRERIGFLVSFGHVLGVHSFIYSESCHLGAVRVIRSIALDTSFEYLPTDSRHSFAKLVAGPCQRAALPSRRNPILQTCHSLWSRMVVPAIPW